MVPGNSSSFLTTTATTTRVRPRAFVYGISNMFEPPPPSMKQRTLKKPQRPTHLPDIAPPTASIPNSYSASTFRSRLNNAATTINRNGGKTRFSSLYPEESTLELLKQLNVNLEETNRVICELKESYSESIREVKRRNETSHQFGQFQIDRQLIPRKLEKVVVSVRVQFVSIGEIDTVNGLFSAEILLQAKWHDPSLDELNEDETEYIDWDSIWMPELTITNECSHHYHQPISINQSQPPSSSLLVNCANHLADQSREFSSVRAITTGKNGLNMVLMRQKIKSTFCFEPRLGLYPFDCQSLPIRVSTSREIDEVDLEEDEYECCSVNLQSTNKQHYSTSSSARSRGHFTVKSLVTTSREIDVDDLQESNHPVFTCTAFVCRNWMAHLCFTFLPIFLLTFALVMIRDFISEPHQSSSVATTLDSTVDVSASYTQSSFADSQPELRRLLNSVVLLLASCFFVFLSVIASFTNSGGGTSFNLMSAYIVCHCLFVLLLTIKTVLFTPYGNQGAIVSAVLVPVEVFQVQLNVGKRVMNVDQIATLLLFLCLNFLFYLYVVILLFARYLRMKRKAKRLMKRQTDYRRLRSAREHSVQSFSNISRSKIPRMRPQRPLSEPNQPRPFSAAVLASEHAGAMPRSKWRLENPPAASDDSSDNLRDLSPDSQFPRSISFPTSSARGLKEIPV